MSYVFNIQKYSLHDGPGIRTIVFLKGCPLRCRWCCNPESQSYNREISYIESKCIGGSECGMCKAVCKSNAINLKQKAAINTALCTNCLRCADICPSKAIKIEGKKYTTDEIINIVENDSVFYARGKGGLTISGGEPLTHKDFVIGLLNEAKKRKINTAIETCGYADYDNLFEIAKYLDYILFDIKSMDEKKHIEYTGQSNDKILYNFERLCYDYPYLPKKVRTPIIPGFNDNEKDIKAILKFIENKPNVSYEPLKYHSFGKGKYKALGREYAMGDVALSDKKFNYLSGLNKNRI